MKKGVITNTVCIVTAIVCIALTFWGNLKNDGVLSTDAYMGVIATLIGICATIVVGFQIVSFMEFRNFREQIRDLAIKQQKVDELYQKMQRYNQKIQMQIRTAQKDLSNAFISIIDYNKVDQKDLMEIMLYANSIICEDMEYDKNGGRATFKRYNCLYELINKKPTKDIAIIKDFIDPIKKVKIPDYWPEHNAIMKIHYEILAILDKVSDDEPTAETEQK